MRAISLALLKVRAIDGMTLKKLAKTLECSTDTIGAATNEETLLSFDIVGRLLYFFPDETGVIRQLWERAEDAPTVDDRIIRIEKELAAIRRATA